MSALVKGGIVWSKLRTGSKNSACSSSPTALPRMILIFLYRIAHGISDRGMPQEVQCCP
jgi:hypothetical protein